jgi:peptide chain release factor 2
MDINAYRDLFHLVKKRYEELRGIIDMDALNTELNRLREFTVEVNFWDDNTSAQKVLKQISKIENEIKMWSDLDSRYNDSDFYMDIINDGEDVDSDSINTLNSFSKVVEQVELINLLNEEDDHRGAILTIHPGAGGTESQDWASMLYRLYTRWCERNKFKIKILDYQDGDEAGLKDVSIEISGNFVYGYLKAERGVHRLVRISPFDSNSRRHTSFASVFIYPLLDDDFEIEIDEKDIRVDTYRASGAGGQHINKTDSAVRLTHTSSGIVVQCQNERSQLKNKKTAMKMLKAKLYQKELDERAVEHEKLEGQKKNIGWGSQIRSYVFHPYNLVKDHRTNIETSNVQSTIDGEIDQFIRAYLLMNMENKSVI